MALPLARTADSGMKAAIWEFAFEVVNIVRSQEPSLWGRAAGARMDLQDVQELTNFFERRVSSYQSAVAGEVAFHEDF